MTPRPHTPPPRRGFTLIDLLLAACVLVILLSLAVSLSRQVRAQSARVLTNDVLARLDALAAEYVARFGAPPGGFPMMPGALPLPPLSEDVAATDGSKPVIDDRAAVAVAERNNRALLRLLLSTLRADGLATLSSLPLAVYDPAAPTIRDAWGTPIAYLPRQSPTYGMAPQDAPFFVSAGPDRRFSTRADNLYSYEVLGK